MGHLVTQFQGQILRAAANNRVRGHASVCGYAPPPSPTWYLVPVKTIDLTFDMHVCIVLPLFPLYRGEAGLLFTPKYGYFCNLFPLNGNI